VATVAAAVPKPHGSTWHCPQRQRAERERGTHPPRWETALPIAVVRGDLQLRVFPQLHLGHALVPPSNDLQAGQPSGRGQRRHRRHGPLGRADPAKCQRASDEGQTPKEKCTCTTTAVAAQKALVVKLSACTVEIAQQAVSGTGAGCSPGPTPVPGQS
jgi:hypothetical protein